MNKFNIEQSLIDKSLMELLPDWWQSINPDDYYLVMTDDADSYYSCQRLQTLFGLEIGGFYDFKSGLYLNDIYTDFGWKNPIYVDLSICQDNYCFDNHRTFIKNSNAVNPNKLERKYSDKYNFGTVTLIAALYGGLEDFTEEQLYSLIAIDGGYIGYYKDGGRWKNVNIFWLEKLGLSDYLLPILEDKNAKFFQDFTTEYGLREKIYINDKGYLETEGSYNLPGYSFDLVQAIEPIVGISLTDAYSKYRAKVPILTSAETYKGKYILNIAV